MSGRAPDCGAGTVLALALVAVLLVLTLAVVGLARAVHARAAAQAAADLAALAAATALRDAAGDPCTVATAVVRANGAEPAGCAVAGAVVEVGARVVVLGQADGVLVARASARAGPAP
ncbi:Rv3654c family TadE-like protein [Georgenia thermotolerans]|uniref:Rv3654c family TadE-like protein n=1 Tax=Georgenia thermotolerans TaxID=527326 RepID=UPI0012640FFF|nr:Rv3654c family TadE-like protein [Georgenia thermotolerans]